MIKRFITGGPNEVCKNGSALANNVTFRGLQFFVRAYLSKYLGKIH